ncbi:MAG TPA: RNA polymerase sigma factor [Thermomicrobiales bacterium]|nr:RNA polymerase sigma factor [Thermomicrobiales bacterium]
MQAPRAPIEIGDAGGGMMTLLADSPARDVPVDPVAVSRESVEIARARRDPAAFAPLYERYVDDVYGYCLRRISHPEQAADLTALVFTRALAALPRYRDSGGTFRSWLFSIAHNLLVDTYRARRETASLDARDQVHAMQDTSAGPEHLALQADLRRAFGVALLELTDGQRDVVELRLAGLTGPEIAGVLGMKLAAVKSTQFRAYTRLRELLAPYADTSPSPEEGHP